MTGAVFAVALSAALNALLADSPPSRHGNLHAAHLVPRRTMHLTANLGSVHWEAKATQLSVFEREQQMSLAQLMDRWNPLILEAAKRFNVPQIWIRSVMQIESGGRTMLAENQPIVSTAGALGLMQLMPATYREMALENHLGPDPFDPHDNIMAAAAYLKWLHARYGYPTMFAAYNDGPGNLEARMINGGLLPVETRNYLVNITAKLNGRGIAGIPSHGSLAKLTRPNGSPVWINGASVLSVRAPFPGEYVDGVEAVIAVGRMRQGVRESVARTRAILRAHGGFV